MPAEQKRCEHLVQFHGRGEKALQRSVGEYLSEGLRRGEGLIIISSGKHFESFLEYLEADGREPAAAMSRGLIVFLDAAQTLAGFMVQGRPDLARFDRTVGEAVRRLQTRCDRQRAYGEMGGLLWEREEFNAATRLEHFWNSFLEASNVFSLLCSYPIDIFASQFDMQAVDHILCSHTRVIPAALNQPILTAIHRAMDEVLGSSAPGLRKLMQLPQRSAWAVMPSAEASILWLRNNLPLRAEEVLRHAEAHYDSAPLPA